MDLHKIIPKEHLVENSMGLIIVDPKMFTGCCVFGPDTFRNIDGVILTTNSDNGSLPRALFRSHRDYCEKKDSIKK